MTIIAVKNPSSDAEAPKTLLFFASSAKGTRLIYDKPSGRPEIDGTLGAVIENCRDPDTPEGPPHRNKGACGEINALLEYFYWARSQPALKPADKARDYLRGAKSISWYRPRVDPPERYAKPKGYELALQRFEELPFGAYRDPCSTNDFPPRTGIGCEAVLDKLGMKVVPAIPEDEWGQNLVQPGDIATKQAISVLPPVYIRRCDSGGHPRFRRDLNGTTDTIDGACNITGPVY